eukprot:424947_1
MSTSRCQKCKKRKTDSSFSGNQLKKQKGQRRCKKCTQNPKKSKHKNKHGKQTNIHKPIRNIDIKCENITNCSAICSIIDVLKFYKTKQTNFKKISEYFNIHKNVIMNAYYHILQKHLNQEILTISECNNNFKIITTLINDKHGLQCNLEQCKVFNRSNRQRERGKVLDLAIDFIDSIHCCLLHSYDIGYILPADISNTNDESKRERTENNRYYDEQLAQLMSHLKQKRKITPINGRVESSKFSTDFKSSYASNEEKTTTNATDANYSFGKSFNYWNAVNNRGLYDFQGCKPKYVSLKSELVSNKLYTINIKVFENAYQKAVNLMRVDAIKCLKCNFFHDSSNYGIDLGRRISLNHILSVIFYTDYTILSCKFSTSFRKLSPNEADEAVKKRNREYGHWTKYLVETVNCFGTKVNESKIKCFFHGVSLIYFDQFNETFNCPTSTTTKLQIATIFAKNDGIILELTQHTIDFDLRYFNCSLISFYSNEDEKLFIQPPDCQMFLKIINIRHMSTMANYSKFFRVMDTLYHLLGVRSDFSDFRVCANVSQQFIDEINDFMNFNFNFEDNNLNYPPYISKTLKKWMNAVKTINIDRITLHKYAKGCLKNIWHDSINNLLKCDQLNVKFKNIELIMWDHVGIVNEGFWKELLKMVQATNKFKQSKLKMITLDDLTINFSSESWELCKILFKNNGWIVEKKVNKNSRIHLDFSTTAFKQKMNSNEAW